MKRLLIIVGLFFALLWNVPKAHAIVDPLESPNNKYGMHIVDENDLDDAAKLVNSSGGEWGYVTFVIREDERDVARWQRAFDRMREKKLIPVIRIATKGTNLGWRKPSEEDAKEWVEFFDELNWVTKNRYVILFNEPNHANEWEGDISPEGYTKVARGFKDALKASSDDYFILSAGFDQAAGDNGQSLDVESYFDSMADADPEIFTIFDGWSSHAYPNPNFSGSPSATGKKTIKGYRWEIGYLEQYGLDQDIPVFITETGWAHKEGISDDASFKSAETVADYFQKAFEVAWANDDIVMISPFLLNYQDDPFDNFSWKKPGSNDYYPQYDRVLGLSKEPGAPDILDMGSVSLIKDIKTLSTNSTFYIPILITNTGQSIWEIQDNVKLIVSDTNDTLGSLPVPSLKPFEKALLKIPIQTPESPGNVTFSLYAERNGKHVTHPAEYTISIRESNNSGWLTESFKKFILSQIN